MTTVEQILLSAKVSRDREKSVKNLEERICTSGCGVMVKLSELSPSAIRYKKFNCVSCENKRKEKYRKVK